MPTSPTSGHPLSRLQAAILSGGAVGEDPSSKKKQRWEYDDTWQDELHTTWIDELDFARVGHSPGPSSEVPGGQAELLQAVDSTAGQCVREQGQDVAIGGVEGGHFGLLPARHEGAIFAWSQPACRKQPQHSSRLCGREGGKL